MALRPPRITGRVGVVLLDELGQAEAAVHMGEPVEIDAEGMGMEVLDERFRVEGRGRAAS